ncbi:MAG: hypothetical protein LBJ47_04555 [Tannerella sp.]|jgi:hypothetical protein|nr:hypothetical protein [Tannerella sp.]
MKNLMLTLIFTTVTVFTANAQYDDLYTFEQGKSLVGVNVGVKFGNDRKTAVSAFYEYGLARLFADECTLGGGLFGGYYRDALNNEVENIYITGIRINVHYQFVDRLDTYAGVDPNFNIKTYKLQKDANEAKFALYFHAGGRYYLTNWLGVFAEISTGYNNFSGGLSIKF